MNYANNIDYINDLENHIDKIDLESLRDKSILITGANGMICSYIIDLLIFANITRNANITIYAMSRNEEKLKNRFEYYYNNELFKPIIQDVCNPLSIDNIDYVIHGASNANPKLYITDPVGTMNANYIGTLNMLNLAVKNDARLLYISSGDIYGESESFNTCFKENQYGYVDILNVRSSYASSKRAAETLCIAYENQYNAKVLIVRPAHIYGPTCTKSDTRAVSDFINKAVNGESIIMKSDGKSTRSYCYVGDASIGILKVLIYGKIGDAYNISNNSSIISIKDLAKIICDNAGVKLEIQIPKTDLEKKIDSNVKSICLDSKKMENLNWMPQTDIENGIKATIKILKR